MVKIVSSITKEFRNATARTRLLGCACAFIIVPWFFLVLVKLLVWPTLFQFLDFSNYVKTIFPWVFFSAFIAAFAASRIPAVNKNGVAEPKLMEFLGLVAFAFCIVGCEVTTAINCAGVNKTEVTATRVIKKFGFSSAKSASHTLVVHPPVKSVSKISVNRWFYDQVTPGVDILVIGVAEGRLGVTCLNSLEVQKIKK